MISEIEKAMLCDAVKPVESLNDIARRLCMDHDQLLARAEAAEKERDRERERLAMCCNDMGDLGVALAKVTAEAAAMREAIELLVDDARPRHLGSGNYSVPSDGYELGKAALSSTAGAALAARVEVLEAVAAKARVLDKSLQVPHWGYTGTESWSQEHDDLRTALAALSPLPGGKP